MLPTHLLIKSRSSSVFLECCGGVGYCGYNRVSVQNSVHAINCHDCA